MRGAAPDDGGLYCYLATPFDANGRVDTGVLRDYVAEIIEAGVTGLTCLASTCEGPYLTESERRLVLETVAKAAAGAVKLNVGAGACSTRQVIEFARCAEGEGATSLMLETPQYFPITREAVRRHYEAVAAAVSLPIRLYNLPWATRLDHVSRLRDLKALCGERFALYCGFHYQALEGFRYGADGWEVMLHPLIAAPCVALYRLLRDDPWSAEGEALFRRLEPMFRFFRVHGVPQSIKAMSKPSGLRLGEMRAPLRGLEGPAEARLRELGECLNRG